MQDFEEEKQEKEKAVKHLQEVEERNSSASHDVKKELDRLREESHQKDLLLQKAAEENLALHQLKATAERNCQEQLEYIEQLNNNQLAFQDELQQKRDEVDRYQQEIQAKTAQVKQYKKQVDALKEKTSHEVEEICSYMCSTCIHSCASNCVGQAWTKSKIPYVTCCGIGHIS